MLETDPKNDSDWFELEPLEREAAPEPAIEFGIQSS